MVIVVSFAAAAVMCSAAFLATYLAVNPWLIPAFPRWSVEFSRPVAAVAAPAGPFFDPATSRWRDPVSKRFVAKPV